MPVYIALLRGINIGPHKRMKMEKLRATCEAIGFEQVQTYVQSGNVVFRARKFTTPSLSSRLEERIVRDFGFPAPVIMRTVEEMGKVIADNPLLKEKQIELEKLHVTFLAELPKPAALKLLDTLPQGPDRFCCLQREVYLHCPNGYGVTKLTNNLFENKLAVGATTRNWRTVNNLFAMAREIQS